MCMACMAGVGVACKPDARRMLIEDCTHQLTTAALHCHAVCRKPYRKPLSRLYFAVPDSSGAGQQFFYFASLVSVRARQLQLAQKQQSAAASSLVLRLARTPTAYLCLGRMQQQAHLLTAACTVCMVPV